MKCSICDAPIKYDIGFKDLFVFDYVCPKCRLLLYPKKTVIPIDNGYVINYYYFLINDEYIERIERKVYPFIFNLIKASTSSIFLFLDDEIMPYLNFLNMCQNITLVSIVYEDLAYFLEDD